MARRRIRGRNDDGSQWWLRGTGGTSVAPPRRGRRRRQQAEDAVVTPPPGSFDPGMEYERGQSQRGLEDLRFDTARADRLGARDLEIALERLGLSRTRNRQDIGRSYSRGVFDTRTDLSRGLEDIGVRRAGVETNFTRDLQDLALADQRGAEDRDRAIASLQRKYTVMAESQAEAAASAGVTRGGFVQQSANKRAANQSIEQAPIDISRARQAADIVTRRGRLSADHSTDVAALDRATGRLTSDSGLALSRLGQDRHRSLRRTNQDYTQQVADARRNEARAARQRALELSRAEREQPLYEQSLTQQEYFAAHQFDPTIRFPTAEDIATGNYTRRGRRRRR